MAVLFVVITLSSVFFVNTLSSSPPLPLSLHNSESDPLPRCAVSLGIVSRFRFLPHWSTGLYYRKGFVGLFTTTCTVE